MQRGEIGRAGLRGQRIVHDDVFRRLRELVKKGVLGVGVFETADCWATYRDLKDNSGNWFSMVQRPARGLASPRS